MTPMDTTDSQMFKPVASHQTYACTHERISHMHKPTLTERESRSVEHQRHVNELSRSCNTEDHAERTLANVSPCKRRTSSMQPSEPFGRNVSRGTNQDDVDRLYFSFYTNGRTS